MKINKQLVLVLKILLSLVLSYSLIYYTNKMKSVPECKIINESQRELLFFAGAFIIVNLMLMFIIKI